MQENEIIEIIEYLKLYKTETNRIEAKSAINGFPKKCYDTISSFSNKRGGIIIFGISEEKDFSVEGVYDLNDLQKQVSSLCSDSMEPAVRADIMPLEYNGKKLLAVKINEVVQNKKPCFYKGKGMKNGSYTRIGDRDELMTDYEIYALQSYNDHIYEDTRPTKRANIKDLNRIELVKFINEIKINKPHFAKNSFERSLKLCGIIDSSSEQTYPTLAGTLIFGNYPQTFYPQLFIACVVVPGVELGEIGKFGERFIDNKRIEGTIEQMLEETLSFLQRNMKSKVIINDDGKRINRTEYPIEALREAVANSLIHRDYSIQTENAYISVYMYANRIEIINPGILYGTNKIEKLGTITSMESRNPTIVRILEEKGAVIENRHSGIPTMIREMKKYGLPEPEFYEERNSFKVVFRNNLQNSTIHSNSQNSNCGTKCETNDLQNSNCETKCETNDSQNGNCGTKCETSDSQNSNCETKCETSDSQNSNCGTKCETSDSQLTINLRIKVLKYCKEPRTTKEIMEYLNITSKRYVAYGIIKPLISAGKLEYTNKNSINARNQESVNNFV